MFDHSMTPYLLAIASNLAFGTASIAFSRFSLSHSAHWMNQLKVSVAFVGFLLAFLIVENYVPLSLKANLFLLTSGFVGLCVGDLFLFRAFAILGPARTLILYSFQPFILAVYGYFMLAQQMSTSQMIAVTCMVGCVLTFVLERNRTHGRLDLFQFFLAFLGIFFDAVGVMLTREAYETSPALGSFQVNTIRAIGAMIGFFLVSPKSYGKLFSDVKRMSRADQSIAVGAAFLGTFVSLSFYLKALKTAHVATLSSIAITLPIWVSLIEHIKLRTWPNRYLLVAFALFGIGFYLMNLQ